MIEPIIRIKTIAQKCKELGTPAKINLEEEIATNKIS